MRSRLEQTAIAHSVTLGYDMPNSLLFKISVFLMVRIAGVVSPRLHHGPFLSIQSKSTGDRRCRSPADRQAAGAGGSVGRPLRKRRHRKAMRPITSAHGRMAAAATITTDSNVPPLPSSMFQASLNGF